MYTFANKVCIITGAAAGLGKALAAALYREGAQLLLIDKDTEALAALSTAFDDKQRVSVYAADISEEPAVIAVARTIQALYQHADVLINSAAVSISQPFEQMRSDDHQRLFDVNYWGTVHCSRHFLPLLKNSPDSRLVNIISAVALMGFPGKTAYASSKAAVMGFTAALRTELSGTGVKVSLVIPPPMPTGIVGTGIYVSREKMLAENEFIRRHGTTPEKAAVKIAKGIKAGRYRIRVGNMIRWTDLASRLFPSLLSRVMMRKRFPFY